MGAIPVRGWAGDVNDTYGITGRLEISVTDDGAQCVPVSMYQYGTTNGGRGNYIILCLSLVEQRFLSELLLFAFAFIILESYV